MSDNRTRKWLSLLAVVAVAVMIFLFSAQEGDESASLSDGVTEWALKSVVPGYTKLPEARKREYLKRTGLLVRKAAHFSEFALLGLTLSIHLRYVLTGRRLRRIALTSWGVSTLYAATDELHQMFVGGRGPAVLDVCIDSAGAVTGAFVGVGLLWLWHRKKRNRLT